MSHRSMLLRPMLLRLAFCAALAGACGCSGSLEGTTESESDPAPTPGKMDDVPTAPRGPEETRQPGAERVVRGVLGCPTEPLPAYGSASVATLSKAFQSNCAACHGGAGQGSDKYPPLPGTLSREQYIAKVRAGVKEMPAFGADFVSDAELAADYANLAKLAGNSAGLVTVANGPDSWSDAEVEAIYQRGLAMWRKPGSIDGQACTNCHSADGVELAIIGFADDAILRRGQQHLSPEDALVVRDFIHAQRRRLRIAEVCSTDWRPFQPGGRVLSGDTPAEQDAAFLRELERRNLMIATGEVVTLADAKRALAELQAIDLRRLPMGIALPRWSEDKFNGPEHRDINDYMAPVPSVPNQPEAYFAIEDEYLRAPTDAGLYKLLQENRSNMNDLGYTKKNTVPHGPGNCPSFDDSTGWIIERITRPKRLSVLVAAHLLREEIMKPGSFYERPLTPFLDAPRAANPAFFLGGFAIEPPCYDANNYPLWIKSFPEGFRDEFPESDLARGVVENATDRVTHNWMTLGQILEPSLMATDSMQDNKLHYWAFRNFTQKDVHLPFMYVHRMAVQAKLWQARDGRLLPTASGPFDQARRDWLHPFLATTNQNSAGLRNAVDPGNEALPAAAANRLKGNLLRVMMLISRDLLETGMAIQQDQNDDHCLSLSCQVRAMRGFVGDLKLQTEKAAARAAYEAAGFDVQLYQADTAALIDEVLALLAKAPRR